MYAHRNPLKADLETICSFPGNAEELFYIGPRFAYPLTPEQMATILEGRTNPTTVIDSAANRPVAYANLYDHNREDASCWLGTVIVANEYRGRGAAEYLLNTMVELAKREHGVRRLQLYCHNPNTRALLFYCKMGFQPCGSKVVYNHRGEKIVAIEMEKEL